MALFLLYAATQQNWNTNQFNSVLFQADDEAVAWTAAQAATPNGDAKVRSTWSALSLGAGAFGVQPRRVMRRGRSACSKAADRSVFRNSSGGTLGQFELLSDPRKRKYILDLVSVKFANRG